MSSIDDRIVRLELQDSDFAKRLEKDEDALKKLSKTIDNVGGSGLANNIQKIADKFSNLGIVGVRTLENIADKAFSSGERLVKSLSVDNIASGWEKLAQQTKAVGTLSIQGFEQSEVDKVIKQLMWYSDETSYNFNDMLTAMTKFTAQSYGLEDSLEVLEGIANWSAVAGQNAAAGSSAMEILSKAIGRGYVGQEQWSSLQTIMMDNKQIRQMILDNAVKMGTLEKVSDNTYRSLSKNIVSSLGASEFNIDQFATYLTTGKWLTSDVLVATMKQYSEAVRPVYEYVEKYNVSAADAIKALNGQLSEQALQFFAAAQEARSLEDALESVRVGSASTWQTTFNTIFGDYEQQKELWTDLSGYLYDLFVESGNRRNALLKEWAEAGGRDSLIQSFYNIMDAITKLRDVFRTAWERIFPPKNAQDILSLTEKFEKFTEKLANADETFEKLGRVVQGVFSILKLGKMVLSALLEPIKEIFGIVDTGSILDIAVAIADTVTNFVHWLEVNDKVHISLKSLSEVAGKLFEIVKAAFGGILTVGSKIITAIKDVISGGKDIATSFKDAFKKPTTEANKFKKVLEDLEADGAEIVDIPMAYAQKINQSFDETVGTLTPLQKVTVAFKTFGKTVKDVYNDTIKPVFTKILDFFGVANWFSNGLIPGLINLFSAFMSFKVIYGFGKIIFSVVNGVADLVQGLTGAIGLIGSLNQSLKAGAFLKAAAAIGILVLSLGALSRFDPSAIEKARDAMVDIATSVGEAINVVSIKSAIAFKILSAINVWPIIAAFGAFAAAIWGVNVALNYISKNSDKFSDSFKEIFEVLSGEHMDTVLNFLSRVADIFGKAVIPLSMMSFAKAIKSLGKSLKSWSLMKFSISTVDTSASKKILQIAESIALIVGALYVITELINPDKLWEALGALGTIALGLSVMFFVLSGLSNFIATYEVITTSKDATKISSQIYNIGKSTLNLSKSVAFLAATAAVLGIVIDKMPGAVKNGIEAIAVIAGVVAVLELASGIAARLSKGQNLGKNIKAVGGAFLEIAFSTLILFASVKLFSLLEWEEIGRGLVGIGVGITVIGAAIGIIMAIIKNQNAIGNLLSLGGAFLMLSGGTILIAYALTVLANAAGDKKLLEAAGSLGIVVGVLVATLAGITAIGYVFTKIKELILGVAAGLVGLYAVGWVVSQVIGFIAPALVTFAEGLAAFNNVDPGSIAKMAAAVAAFLAISAIGGVPSAVPLLILTGVLYLFSKVLEGAMESFIIFCEGLERYGPGASEGISKLGTAVSDSISNIAESIPKLGSAIGDAIVSIAEAIVEAKVKVTTWPLAVLETLKASGKGIISSVGQIFKEDSEYVGFNLTAGLASGMASNEALTKLSNATKDVMWHYNDGFGVHSESDLTYETGYWMTSGMASGMKDQGALQKIADSCLVLSGAVNDNVGKNLNTLMGVSIPQATQKALEKTTQEETVNATSRLLGNVLGDNTSSNLLDTFSTDSESGITSFFKNLSNPNSESNWAAGLFGSSLAESTTMSYAEKITAGMNAVSKYLSKTMTNMSNVTKGVLAGLKLNPNINTQTVGDATAALAGYDRIYQDIKKDNPAFLKEFANTLGSDAITKTAIGIRNMNSDIRKAGQTIGAIGDQNEKAVMRNKTYLEELYSELDAIFSRVEDNPITPVFDSSSWDDMYNKMASDMGKLTGTDLLGAEQLKTEKQLEDWELSTEELIRKYSTLSTSYDPNTGNINRFWTYNGPMGGEIVPGEVEWVYEGPKSGIYDIAEDKYMFEVKGHVEDIANWNSQWQDIYYGYAEYQTESLDSINNNTQQLNNSILDQTELQELYNQQMQEQLSSIIGQIDDLKTNVTGLGDDFSSLGVYLDGKTLVGQLTDQIDSSLGSKQALVSRGVIR